MASLRKAATAGILHYGCLYGCQTQLVQDWLCSHRSTQRDFMDAELCKQGLGSLCLFQGGNVNRRARGPQSQVQMLSCHQPACKDGGQLSLIRPPSPVSLDSLGCLCLTKSSLILASSSTVRTNLPCRLAGTNAALRGGKENEQFVS